ncbi:MAG: uracil-DNA glycosylase [Gammaproteobacteria bacterium]|nr:MAG: uracil-DNA glycosylase [Gammaproteobacteria bacterium]
MATDIPLEPLWKARLSDEFEKDYMHKLRRFLLSEKRHGKTVFPPDEHYFKALDATPFDQVKVVVLGQDPYHGDDQAHGLSFSVPEGVRPPPSLKNIFKELSSDLGCVLPNHGCLDQWSSQGVLLLNSVLTVERGKAASHQRKGWEQFTDRIIEHINEHRAGVVFLLWGAYAQKKGAFIDQDKHCVLKAPHPSPLSAHRGFLGCKHFSKANQYLQANGATAIDWQLQDL